MKVPNATKSTNKHAFRHNKAVSITVIVTGLLLGFLTGLQFIIQGIENSLIAEDNKIFANNTYLVASACKNSDNPDNDCKTNTTLINDKVNAKIKPYNGTIVGHLTIIKNQNVYFYAAPSEPFSSILEASTAKQPEGSLSAVVGFERAADLVKDQLVNKSYDDDKIAFVNEVRQKTIGKTFSINGMNVFIAGIIPYGSDNFRVTKQGESLQPLNQILQIIDGNNVSTNKLIFIANNSTEFQQLLAQSTIDQKLAIINFSDRKQAYNFYYQEKLRHNPDGVSHYNQTSNQELEVDEFITSTLLTIYWFKKAKMAIAIASGALILIVIIASSLMLMRKTSNDTGSAKVIQSSLIKFSLKFLALGLTTAAVMATIVSYCNAEIFNSAISLLFGHESNSFKLLLGINEETLVTILIIPVMTTIVLFLAGKNRR